MRVPLLRAGLGFVLAMGGTTSWGITTLNVAQTLAKTKAKLANGQQADVLVLGDSLSFADGSYLPVLRNDLQAKYGNAGAGWQGFSMWTDGAVNVGWSGGIISQDVAPYYSLDGLWVESNTVHDIGYLKPQNATIQLQYLAQPGGGTFQPYVEGSGGDHLYLAPTIDTNSTTKEVRTWTYTIPNYTPGMDIWYRQQSAGTVTLLGQNNTTSTPGIRIDRAANGGWKTTNFLQRDPTFDQQVSLLNPDLVMIMLGANDAGSETGPEFESNLTLLINRIHQSDAGADVLLVAPYDLSYATDPSDLHYQRVVEPEIDLAEQLGIGFINLHDLEDYSFWMNNKYLVDGIHQSWAGGDYLGNLLSNAFITDGASLVPEPASLMLCAPMLLLMRRRSR